MLCTTAAARAVALGAREADHELDVLKVEIPVETTPETEQFTITFDSDSTAAKMNFAWDKSLVRVPITVPQ